MRCSAGSGDGTRSGVLGGRPIKRSWLSEIQVPLNLDRASGTELTLDDHHLPPFAGGDGGQGRGGGDFRLLTNHVEIWGGV